MSKPEQNLPKGWKWVRLGDLFTERNEKGYVDLPLLAITADRGVIPRDELEKRDTSNQDKSKYLRIMPGDIGYNTMRMWQGVCGVSQFEGIVSPAYTICIPNERIDARFAAYLFKTDFIIAKFRDLSQGLVDDTLSLKFKEFSRVFIPLPPLPVQRWIADALGSVDKWIEASEDTAALLKTSRKKILADLFTGEDIPLSEMVSTIDSGVSVEGENKPAEVGRKGVLKVSAVSQGFFFSKENKTIATKDETRARLSVQANSIIVSRSNTIQLVGEVGMPDRNFDDLFLPDKLWVLNPNLNKKVNPIWLLYALVNLKNSGHVAKLASGSSGSMKNISQSSYLKLKVPKHNITRQKKIVLLMRSVDKNLMAQLASIEEGKAAKQALLNQLLSGKLQPMGGWGAVT